jgi:hypothetical protein
MFGPLFVPRTIHGLGHSIIPPAKASMNAPITVADPNAHPASHPRLGRQAQKILDSFKLAPDRRLTCVQLLAIAQRFGARLYDIRQAGYVISLVKHDHASGFTVYELQAS